MSDGPAQKLEVCRNFPSRKLSPDENFPQTVAQGSVHDDWQILMEITPVAKHGLNQVIVILQYFHNIIDGSQQVGVQSLELYGK